MPATSRAQEHRLGEGGRGGRGGYVLLLEIFDNCMGFVWGYGNARQDCRHATGSPVSILCHQCVYIRVIHFFAKLKNEK